MRAAQNIHVHTRPLQIRLLHPGYSMTPTGDQDHCVTELIEPIPLAESSKQVRAFLEKTLRKLPSAASDYYSIQLSTVHALGQPNPIWLSEEKRLQNGYHCIQWEPWEPRQSPASGRNVKVPVALPFSVEAKHKLPPAQCQHAHCVTKVLHSMFVTLLASSTCFLPVLWSSGLDLKLSERFDFSDLPGDAGDVCWSHVLFSLSHSPFLPRIYPDLSCLPALCSFW